MARSSTLALTDLLTASRLPGLHIGRAVPAVEEAPAVDPSWPTADPSPPAVDPARPFLDPHARTRSLPLAPSVSDWSLDALAGRFVEISSAGTSIALTAVTALLLEAQLRREPVAWVAIGGTTFYPPDLAEAGVDLESLPVVRVSEARTAARAADLLLRSGGFTVVVIDGIGSPYARRRQFVASRTRFYPGYGPAYSQNADRRAQDALHERRYVPDESRARGLHDASGSERAGARRSAASRRGSDSDALQLETSATLPTAAQTRLAGLAKKHRAVLVCITYKEDGAPSLGSLVSLRGTGRVRKTAFDRFTWELAVLKDKRRGSGWEHSGVCRGPTGLY